MPLRPSHYAACSAQAAAPRGSVKSRFESIATWGTMCGCVAAGLYLVYAIAFEAFVLSTIGAPDTPRLSYGQQFGMIMMPLAALLGAGAGASIALALRSAWWLAAGASLAISGLVAAAVTGLWNSSIARYGVDPSDGVLYAPILYASFAGILASALPAGVAVATTILRQRPSSVRGAGSA